MLYIRCDTVPAYSSLVYLLVTFSAYTRAGTTTRCNDVFDKKIKILYHNHNTHIILVRYTEASSLPTALSYYITYVGGYGKKRTFSIDDVVRVQVSDVYRLLMT